MTERDSVTEPKDRTASPAGMLGFFEELGDELYKRFDNRASLQTKIRSRNPTLKDVFLLTTGEKVEINYLPSPVLFRNRRRESVSELPEMWLPSGHLTVTTTEEDGTEVLKSYMFGRSLVNNENSVILKCDTWKKEVGDKQRLVASDRIFTNNAGELDFLRNILGEVEKQLQEDPSRTPTL